MNLQTTWQPYPCAVFCLHWYVGCVFVIERTFLRLWSLSELKILCSFRHWGYFWHFFKADRWTHFVSTCLISADTRHHGEIHAECFKITAYFLFIISAKEVMFCFFILFFVGLQAYLKTCWPTNIYSSTVLKYNVEVFYFIISILCCFILLLHVSEINITPFTSLRLFKSFSSWS